MRLRLRYLFPKNLKRSGRHGLWIHALKEIQQQQLVWAHILLPYLPPLARASTINCPSVSFGNLETVLGICDNHFGWN